MSPVRGRGRVGSGTSTVWRAYDPRASPTINRRFNAFNHVQSSGYGAPSYQYDVPGAHVLRPFLCGCFVYLPQTSPSAHVNADGVVVFDGIHHTHLLMVAESPPEQSLDWAFIASPRACAFFHFAQGEHQQSRALWQTAPSH